MEQGLIMNSLDYQENNKIIYILTKSGKDSILVPRAKRIKSSLVNEIQNLNLIKYEKTSSKSLAKPKQLEVIDYYFPIKNDIKKMAIAEYCLEVVYRLINIEENSEVLYNLVIAFLNQLSKRSDIKMILLEFRIKMLYFLGIAPSFKACTHCGVTKNLKGLSIESGGVECKDHISSDNIGEDATKIISLLYYDKSFEITYDNDEVIDYISEIITKYYEKHFEEKIKSISLLKNLGLM